MKTFESTRLRIGDTIAIGREEFLVVMVNPSRAQAIPSRTNEVQFLTPDGSTRSFIAHQRSISISPNSEVPILTRGGEAAIQGLKRHKSVAVETSTPNQTDNESESHMKTKTSNEVKPKRGGLAEAKRATEDSGKQSKAEKPTKAKPGGLGKCAFVRQELQTGNYTRDSLAEEVVKRYGGTVETAKIVISVQSGVNKKAGDPVKLKAE